MENQKHMNLILDGDEWALTQAMIALSIAVLPMVALNLQGRKQASQLTWMFAAEWNLAAVEGGHWAKHMSSGVKVSSKHLGGER